MRRVNTEIKPPPRLPIAVLCSTVLAATLLTACGHSAKPANSTPPGNTVQPPGTKTTTPTPPPPGSTTTTPLPTNPTPQNPIPAAILATIKSYASARENSIGANQTSPTSWLTQVAPLMTAAGLASAKQYSPLSTGGSYAIAHQNNWIISASVTNCVWASQENEPTGQTVPSTTVGPLTQASVNCVLNDTVEDSTSHQPIPSASLPYGWDRAGPQPPLSLVLVNQNGKWLISSDNSSAGY